MERNSFMKWTDPVKHTHYTQATAQTPIGVYSIDWIDAKLRPVYYVWLGTDYIGPEYDLTSAKQRAEDHLLAKYTELFIYIFKTNPPTNESR
jgi:hypothetical protein